MSHEDTQTLIVLADAGEAERRAELALKRLADVVLGGILLVLAAPLLLLLAALVRATSAGPAFFRQTRVGWRGERFRMLKLRTMTDGAECLEEELADPDSIFFKAQGDARVTPLGRFLRRSSLDELPQLVNVVRGEMSLVGPRPLLERDFARYPRGRQLRRFGMRPGMTGLWQVSGRSLLPDSERLRLDLRYVEHWSLGLDAEILLRTIPAALSGRGAL
ncbi:MAG: sugar transferase [Thermoanaerobaculia bacterium]|nr:MAG: sugar transferase [Thermoanaerobaculia bacterium]